MFTLTSLLLRTSSIIYKAELFTSPLPCGRLGYNSLYSAWSSAIVPGTKGISFSGISLASISSGEASTCHLFNVLPPNLPMLANLAPVTQSIYRS